MKSGVSPEGRRAGSWLGRRAGASLALVFATSVIATAAADCGGGASCEAVCDNVVDKCSAGIQNSVGYNNCVEDCSKRVNTVPEKCAAERDAVLGCLSSADALDCVDAQNSAACAKENATLVTCALGQSSSPTSSTGGGPSCEKDGDCPSGLCNEKLNQCSTPGALGSACFRDEECQNGVCNSKLEQCADNQANGGPCFSDDECQGALCNSKLEACADPGPPGSPCFSDDECASGSCSASDICT